MRLNVLLTDPGASGACLRVEIEVDDPATSTWLGHATSVSIEQLWACAPRVMELRVIDGPLAGREASAMLLDLAFGPVLVVIRALVLLTFLRQATRPRSVSSSPQVGRATVLR